MLKFAKFIGANTDFSTAQAYLFPRVFSEDSVEPVFGLVISGEGEDIFIYVRQIILNLEESFSSPFERVTEKLHELAQIIKTEFSKVENLKFTLFCAKENVFYVLQFGNNIVEIYRDDKSLPIIQNSLQEKVVSGFLQSGDKVLVLSAKPGDFNWNEAVVDQVFKLASDDIDDAELIFASSEQKNQNQEDLAGVKNIEPVAFILINNPSGKENLQENKPTSLGSFNGPKIKVKLKIPRINIWLLLHSLSRRVFGLIRRMNRKLLIGISVLLVVLLISGGGYLFLKSRNTLQNQRVSNLLISFESDLNEAGNIKDTDSKAAFERLAQAKGKLDEASGLEKDSSRIAEAKNKFESKQSEVLKIYRDFSLELFMSLDLIKGSFKTQRLSFSVGKILLLDTNEKSLVAIDTELKTPSIIAGPQQLGSAKIASLNGSHAFVYSPDKGLTHTDIDVKKTNIVAQPDSAWGNIADVFGFSGNVYVLDTGKSKIWKYAPTETGYSEKIDYLRSDANLALGKKLMIDYSVWVLTGEPDILKFTAGDSDYFALSGLNEPLTQIDSIYIPEELDSVFILDKLSNRILVTKKNGEYLAQYINDQFGKVDDFFVDEAQKQIYLLIENKIYTTPLR